MHTDCDANARSLRVTMVSVVSFLGSADSAPFTVFDWEPSSLGFANSKETRHLRSQIAMRHNGKHIDQRVSWYNVRSYNGLKRAIQLRFFPGVSRCHVSSLGQIAPSVLPEPFLSGSCGFQPPQVHRTEYDPSSRWTEDDSKKLLSSRCEWHLDQGTSLAQKLKTTGVTPS